MDRTTAYVILGLVILLAVGALIYANTASVREPTNAPGSAAGTGGTTDRQTAPPAPATPSPPPATKP